MRDRSGGSSRALDARRRYSCSGRTRSPCAAPSPPIDLSTLAPPLITLAPFACTGHSARMRLVLAFFGSVSLIGCTPAPTPLIIAPPAPVSVASASASASATPPLPPPTAPIALDSAMPASPALVATVSGSALSSLLSIVIAAQPPDQRESAERKLNLPRGALSSHTVLSDLGVDMKRPIVVAVASLSTDARPAFEELRSRAQKLLAPPQHEGGSAQAIHAAFKNHGDAVLHTRLLVPASDPVRLLNALTGILEAAELPRVAAAAPLQAVWYRSRVAVALLSNADGVVIDVVSGFPATAAADRIGERIVATLRSTLSGSGQAAASPPLEGHFARVTFSPASLSELAFIVALSSTHASILGTAGNRDWSAARGLLAAAPLLDIVSGDRGPRYERVDIVADYDAGKLSAVETITFGAAQGPVAPSAWAPTPSIQIPQAQAFLDASRSSVQSIPLARSPYIHWGDLVRGADLLGFGLALATLPAGMGRVPMLWGPGVPDATFQRLERYGYALVPKSPELVFWGLLPPSATAPQAACTLAEPAVDCTKLRLAAGGVQNIGFGVFARLAAVGKRFVVLTSRDRAALARVDVKLTSAPVAPVHASFTYAALPAQKFFYETEWLLAPAGPSAPPVAYEFDTTLEANQLRMALRPAGARRAP